VGLPGGLGRCCRLAIGLLMLRQAVVRRVSGCDGENWWIFDVSLAAVNDPVSPLPLGLCGIAGCLPWAFWSLSGSHRSVTAVRLLVEEANLSLRQLNPALGWDRANFPDQQSLRVACFRPGPARSPADSGSSWPSPLCQLPHAGWDWAATPFASFALLDRLAARHLFGAGVGQLAWFDLHVR